MIPVDSPQLLSTAVEILTEYGKRSEARGRFISLYLGLRRMGPRIAPLGSSHYTSASEIQSFLDEMWTKMHRPGSRVVLTAPFGASGLTGGYSARTGQVAEGLRSPANTWRNNLGIQKGVGCVADPDQIYRLIELGEGRAGCPHMEISKEHGHVCGLSGTRYRGEEHAIWLRSSSNGYQVVDLDRAEVYEQYLQPSGVRIPILPLLVVLYSLSPPAFYPPRVTVAIPDFAADFGFELTSIEKIFDCDFETNGNQAILRVLEDRADEFAFNLDHPVDVMHTDALPIVDLPELRELVHLNDGVGAEILIARDLERAGWIVSYTGNQGGLGYDLRAEKPGSLLHIEVKSSLGFTTPQLTQSEWDAAMSLGESYVLAIVDFCRGESPSIWYVRDPAGSLVPRIRTTATYSVNRGSAEALGTEVDFL